MWSSASWWARRSGISVASWGAVRLGWADLPDDVTGRQLLGAAALGGIGFTVSLFITALAFEDPALIDQAKVGVLAASVLATVLAVVLLRGRTPERHTPVETSSDGVVATT